MKTLFIPQHNNDLAKAMTIFYIGGTNVHFFLFRTYSDRAKLEPLAVPLGLASLGNPTGERGLHSPLRAVALRDFWGKLSAHA